MTGAANGRAHAGYRIYLLAVLLVLLAFNNVDRLALGLLLQEIKRDMSLTDTQLGFLTGIAFALFYSVMGIPIARWADRGNRVTIISLTAALWSVMVALSAAATSFAQLLLVRIGVAVGEAGCMPPAHSLIADSFERAERPRAAAVYMLGAPLSGVIGYFLAGWLNELYGWRMTFVLLGIPGLLLALVARGTLREPRLKSGAAAANAATPAVTAGLIATCAVLWAIPTFRHLLLAFSVVSFFGSGILQWQPAFFIRSHGLQTADLGVWLALNYGLVGTLGTYAGGALAIRFAAGNERLQLRAMALSFALFGGAVSALIYIVPNPFVAFGLMALATVGGAATVGPLFATIQTLVPDRMRATSIAIIYLFANLIGMGLGPFAIGALSDALRPLFGESSLRYALLVMSPGYLWGAWHLWRGARTVECDVSGIGH